MAAKLAKEYDLRSSWDGDVLHFDRSGLHGTLAKLPPKIFRWTSNWAFNGRIQRTDSVGDGDATRRVAETGGSSEDRRDKRPMTKAKK